MVQLLHEYCSKNPKLRDDQLHYVQHAYNHAIHSSTQRYPFDTCFGYFGKYPLEFVYGNDSMENGQEDVDKALKHMKYSNNWTKSMPNIRQDMTSTMWIIISK